MSSEEPLYSILEFILNKASAAELEVIAEALKRRQGPGKAFGGINPRSMAERMAKNVEQQLGGMLDVHSISRQIVTDIVKQREPNISDEELEVLLEHWLPSAAEKSETGGQKAIPPDVLVTMVSQYLESEKGTLSRDQEKELPSDWRSRYRDSFPDHVRALIQAHLNGETNEVDFWKKLIASLNQ